MTTLILELNQYSPVPFKDQLINKINSAPAFFQQSPVIISLEQLPALDTLPDVTEIMSICREAGLQPIGFKATDPELSRSISRAGLAVIQDSNKKVDNTISRRPETSCKSTRLIDRTVRSGQQIYAEGCDLIILGSVSGGAEVLADGNIHIYGTLRGRALAGVQGNTDARIFCSKTEAELASIAGHFLLSDSISKIAWQQPAQFYLEDETLHVSALS